MHEYAHRSHASSSTDSLSYPACALGFYDFLNIFMHHVKNSRDWCTHTELELISHMGASIADTNAPRAHVHHHTSGRKHLLNIDASAARVHSLCYVQIKYEHITYMLHRPTLMLCAAVLPLLQCWVGCFFQRLRVLLSRTHSRHHPWWVASLRG